MSNFLGKLNPLFKMQFKDKIDFSFLRSKKRTMFKVVYSILLFLMLCLVLKIIFGLIASFRIFSFFAIINFRAFLVLMTVIFILSFISCLMKVTNTLYFAKDNSVLIVLPVSHGMLFTSKLLVSLTYEMIKNINFVLPFFVAYGLTMKLSALFYLWIIFSVTIYTILVVAIAGLFSIPTMYLSMLVKQNKWLEFILLFGTIGLVTFAVLSIVNSIPEDIDLIRDWGRIYWDLQAFLNNFAQKMVLFDYLLQFMSGMKYGPTVKFNVLTTKVGITLFVVLSVVILCLGLTYLLAKPLFLKMTSSPFEYKKNESRQNLKNKKKPAFLSAINQNIIRIFRTSNIIYSILSVAVITPIAVFLQNKIIGAMDTRIWGNNMAVAFNVLIVMLLTTSSNSVVATMYSREGNSAYLNKINPVSYCIPLTAKIVLNSLINVMSIIVSCVIINFYAHIGVFATIILALAMSLIYLAHLCWSAELDLMNPQNPQYQTTGDNPKNPNEFKSTLIAFIVSIVFSLAAFVFMNENMNSVFFKLLFFGILLFSIRAYLFYARIKVYYKEK